ncbi:hypothetical protein DPMN_115338 [Dreissena polymorpha]|uniref:Uncharacterized protein n=1 Tax=Dreissena polymorpha TaxID=45954 RepID=A0A9D4KM98_DREPO|nr:hypothetical protein DPMN_115338 [Dreissena polymorpha]
MVYPTPAHSFDWNQHIWINLYEWIVCESKERQLCVEIVVYHRYYILPHNTTSGIRGEGYLSLL